MLILQEIKPTVSPITQKCDGVQMMFDFMNSATPEQKIYYIGDLFRMRKMKIQPTETYLHIELVDTETGDLMEINIKRNVHQKLIERKIYPTQLIQLFKTN